MFLSLMSALNSDKRASVGLSALGSLIVCVVDVGRGTIVDNKAASDMQVSASRQRFTPLHSTFSLRSMAPNRCVVRPLGQCPCISSPAQLSPVIISFFPLSPHSGNVCCDLGSTARLGPILRSGHSNPSPIWNVPLSLLCSPALGARPLSLCSSTLAVLGFVSVF